MRGFSKFLKDRDLYKLASNLLILVLQYLDNFSGIEDS